MGKRLPFLFTLAALFLADVAILADPAGFSRAGKVTGKSGQAARALGLTDLSLWTEARYTRHPTQTDFFSPFQDLPGGMEHFPAGALISPPSHLREFGAARGVLGDRE